MPPDREVMHRSGIPGRHRGVCAITPLACGWVWEFRVRLMEGVSLREPAEPYILARVRKYARFLARGFITDRELASGVFDVFAHTEIVCAEIVPEIWAAIPGSSWGEFAAAVRDAVRPDFRFRAFYIGGGRPLTVEEMQREAEILTARVQTWAREFARFMDELTL